jgi:hypothetical protein
MQGAQKSKREGQHAISIITPAIKHVKDRHAGLDPASSLYGGSPLLRE